MREPLAAIPNPNRVFVDTSAYFALYNAGDFFHLNAVTVIETARRRLFTTNFIVAESHALLLRRLGRAVAALFLDEIYRSGTVIIRISDADERRARVIIATHDDKDYSLTDATSFAVMERLRIGTAFTFDRHFGQYGFALLGPDEP
ncbi:MAG: type II toxin-antitoxin system VapC family toxin [Chloroflexia bacterium]|nr:type II toxin-antitoxin system VapC family toxin [Chloroflexia bacterium]